MSSVGSNCVNLVFGKGDIIYLSGQMRDFHKSTAFPTYLTDFNRPENQVDLGKIYVESTLGSDGLPVFKQSAGAASVDANNFKWSVKK